MCTYDEYATHTRVCTDELRKLATTLAETRSALRIWSALSKDVRQNCRFSVVRDVQFCCKVLLNLLRRQDDGKGSQPSFPKLCKYLFDIPRVNGQLLEKRAQFCLVSTLIMLSVHTVRIIRRISYLIGILQPYDTQGAFFSHPLTLSPYGLPAETDGSLPCTEM